MAKNQRFLSALFSFLLFLCSILLFPADVSAALPQTDHSSIKFSAEELAYRDQAGEITIGCPVNNCPLLFQNEKTKQIEGISIDILDMIAEKTGLTFRYQALPSGSITYEDLQQLGVDMVAGVEANAFNKHSLGIVLTDTYLHAAKVFVCKKGTVFHPDTEMTIAVNSGSQTLERVIKQQYPLFEVLFCSSAEEALSALRSGKADAVLQNQYTIERLLRKPLYGDLQIVATASIGDSQCLAFLVPVSGDKQNSVPDDISLLLSVINKGIAALDQSRIAFSIIRETSENAYQFTLWDMLYHYRFAMIGLFISLLLILILLRKNRILHQKRREQTEAQQRAKELAAINAQMKEQQLLLMDALNHAEEGNRAKNSFLFNMSHDIRTPMNAILGFTEIALHNKNDTAKLTDCLEKIQVSGKHLLQLINNVLDMTKLENGNVTLAEDNCDLEACIRKTQTGLQTEIDHKNLTFQADTSAIKNKWVYCDSLRFDQILFNLLSNAVKFSKPGGSILVTVSQEPCAIQEYAVYKIHVKDNGIGMSPEFLSRIFEPFEREYTSTISQTQGSGLGMAITKNLVQLMGGTIQVTSELGRGTEFVLQFTFKLQENVPQAGQTGPRPRQTQRQPDQTQHQSMQTGQPDGQVQHQPGQARQRTGQAQHQAIQAGQPDGQAEPPARQMRQQSEEQPLPAFQAGAASTGRFSGKRLLLVDDNELNMEIAQELLCEVGFLVETAMNGQIAVEMVENSAPGYYDAVLMDIQMPVMDGYQASRKIRSLKNKKLAEIPVIALTANAFDEDKKEALSNGMNAHIAKPLDIAVLYETLEKILKDR